MFTTIYLIGVILMTLYMAVNFFRKKSWEKFPQGKRGWEYILFIVLIILGIAVIAMLWWIFLPLAFFLAIKKRLFGESTVLGRA